MRIGHYAPHIWAPGGIASYIRTVSAAQVSAGHEIVYLSNSSSDDPTVNAQVVSTVDELFAAAAESRVDILHLHNQIGSLPEHRVPTIRTIHGNQSACPSGSRYLAVPGKPCDRKYSIAGCAIGHVVNRCGSIRPHAIREHFGRIKSELKVLPHLRVLTVSEYLRKDMLRLGYPADRVSTLLSPAPEIGDAEVTALPEGTNTRLLFMGRVVPSKGLAWLLRALPKVDTSISLDVAGDGHDLPAMRKLAERLELSNRVNFHGWLSAQDVAKLVEDTHVVMFPSVWHEPAGLVTIEAAARGRAVVAGRVGGIPEYASDEFAVLVEPNNVDALAKAISELAGDHEKLRDMGTDGRRIARARFPMDRFIDELHDYYREVVGSHERMPLDVP